MTRSAKGNLKSRGFTLIEVIVTILAVAIVGVIFINFMGTAMSKSFLPIEMVQGEANAEATIERIVADYVYELNQNPDGGLSTIKGYIDSPTLKYGTNVVCAYIVFDTNGNEGPDSSGDNRTLKITVAAAGNDLVTLLAKSRDSDSPRVSY
jgi:prepilin-type N-terminal cleavage/methylation domain-containing protein